MILSRRTGGRTEALGCQCCRDKAWGGLIIIHLSSSPECTGGWGPRGSPSHPRRTPCPSSWRTQHIEPAVTSLLFYVYIEQTLLSKVTYNKYIYQKKEKQQYKDVHRTKCQAQTITRLTHSLYTTKIARIRCYTMLSTIFSMLCRVYLRTQAHTGKAASPIKWNCPITVMIKWQPQVRAH